MVESYKLQNYVTKTENRFKSDFRLPELSFPGEKHVRFALVNLTCFEAGGGVDYMRSVVIDECKVSH